MSVLGDPGAERPVFGADFLHKNRTVIFNQNGGNPFPADGAEADGLSNLFDSIHENILHAG